MVEYVWRNGARLTPWMNYRINQLDAECYRLFGCHIVVSSGIRTYEEQVAIFLARYVTAGNIRGRKVYDTRRWNGVLWYRISPAGTVAVPSTSNHEIQGNKAAVDIRDTGSDSGITNRNSARGRWLRSVCGQYDLVASGDGFGEGWHFDVLNIFKTPPGSGAGGGDAPFPPNPPAPIKRRKKGKNMNVVYYTNESADKERSGVLGNTETGFKSTFGWFPPAYANGVAKGAGLEAAGAVTRGQYNQILKDLDNQAAIYAAK